jgi:predicted nucleic acid-binding protein
VSQVYADTFYFLALLNPRDEKHRTVQEWSRTSESEVVTTDYVLVEVADGMAHSRHRVQTAALVGGLHSMPGFRVVEATAVLRDQGLTLYANRPDKEWSLTDCISFVVMEQAGLREALTGDRHFAQAGFVALFAD